MEKMGNSVDVMITTFNEKDNENHLEPSTYIDWNFGSFQRKWNNE